MASRVDMGHMESVRLEVMRLPGNEDIPLPRQMTVGAAGLDVCAAETVTLHPGDIRLVSCGFAMKVPIGWEAQVRPRSGLASRHGITLINSPGTIDADYRGEVKVPLINLGREVFVVERAMRIAQLVLHRVPSVNVVEVATLDQTPRGTGGFGHTGQ